jgi:hypothetical protein
MSVLAPSSRGVLLTRPPFVRDPFWRVAGQVPVFDVDFTSQSTIDRIGGITPTFTRPASTKLAWNGTHFVEYAADVPAFQLASDGVWEYLHEPAATNIIADGTDLSAAFGSNTISASPIGPGNITQYREDATTNQHRLEVSIPSLNGATGTYVHSVRFRPVGRRYYRFRPISTDDANTLDYITIDTELDEIIDSGSPVASKLRRLNSEWLEVEVAVTLGGGSTVNQWRIQNRLDDGLTNYTGDPTKGVDVYIPQVEAGTVATSAIITTGSTVTRAADSMTVSGAPAAALVAALGSSYWAYGEGSISVATGSTECFIGGDAAHTQRWRIGHDGTGNSQVVTVNGTIQADLTTVGNIWTPGLNKKIAGSFSLDNFRTVVQGSSIASDVLGTPSTSWNEITIGTAQSITNLQPLRIRRLTLFPGVPSDSNLSSTVNTALANPYQNAPWLPLQGNPLWIAANQVPAFDLDFTQQSIIDRIAGVSGTFTRPSSTQLAWNGTQFVEYAADQPAYEFVPGVGWGLRLSPTATNLCINSQALNGAGWVNVSAPVTDDALVAPDGTLTGDIVSSTSGTFDRRACNPTYTGTGDKGISIFIRQGSSNRTSLNLIELTGVTSRGVAVVTWSAGVPQLTLSNGAINPLIEGPYNNGWWRVGFVAVGVVHTNAPQFRIQPNTADGSALDVGIWGVQLEDNASITTPIITAGSTVTRNADSFVFTGSAFSSWYPGSGSATIYSAQTAPIDSGANQFIYSIDNSADAVGVNEIRHFYGSGLNRYFAISSSSVIGFSYSTGGETAGTYDKSALAVALDNVAVAGSGFTRPATDTSVALPVGLDRLSLGKRSNSSFRVSGVLHRFAVFTGRLGDSALDSMVL